MATIEVFDPPMCCSTGVCGPEPDERLAQFSADLDWLKRQGMQVRRYNLSQEPAAFVNQPDVARVLRETDGEGLPVVIIDGSVVSHGEYPARQRLAEMVGLSARVDQNPGAQPSELQRQSPSLSVVPPGGGCCGGSKGNDSGCC
ncbi:arsenite efflux transporter metallochaperone ArsD [Candidatus Laterigemmans baculatus]|uniref:arsenite efflux transporter metallochaperone ArsD n=1 Tax=Candidatus Laterigemmans baculatus TaxID=2770505 RepID=UPI0013DD423E|nr:arsenite efflux transporter metallochaperone ArsD [Candidatus Laterigemmans baculatus]